MMDTTESVNREKCNPKNLAEVFKDTDTHMKVAKIIADHLYNFRDIRNMALKDVDFTNVRNILDLGCGFGYFTRGLKNRVHPDAMITGIDCHSKYKQLYLQACLESGIKGSFISDGISVIDSIAPKSVDLVLCSYALYYFPECIQQISRILKLDGIFIVITHARPHMKEFSQYVKNILCDEGIECQEPLPYEALIENFSSENGKQLLAAGFLKIKSIKYKGRLLFNQGDFENLFTYFRFKRSFFIPCKEKDIENLSAIILDRMKNDLLRLKKFEIPKEDIIFICKETRNSLP